ASTLETLSHGNRDGWAASMFTRDRAWHSQQYVGSSAAHELLTSTKVDAFAVIAQTHMRTLGEATRTRTPPFRRGRWVFAHGGAIDDLLFIKSRTSPERRERAGEAGGEMLFSFLLTRLDERDLTERHAPEQVDAAVIAATKELHGSVIGSSSFLLADGD